MKIKFTPYTLLCMLMSGVLLSLVSCPPASEGVNVKKGYVDPKSLNTGLPIIKIDTEGNAAITSKENYITAAIEITDPNDATNNFKGTTEIRGRGNITWTYPKKPYRIKLPKKESLFGLTKAKSWVLLANFRDPTLIINTIAFELGKRFGLPFTNHYVYVDLILNGVYEGSYVLTEQVQVGEGRVNINEDDGFLVELDFHYDDEPKFKTNRLQLPVMIKSPEDLSYESEYNFVKEAINNLESALLVEGYRDLIDMETFVDFILINDVLRNWELQVPASIYMYKDEGLDSKISMGPLWDFDGGFGYADDDRTFFVRYDGRTPEIPGRTGAGQLFFRKFFEDSVFQQKYRERWNKKKSDIEAMITFIDETANKLYESQKADYQVWPWNGQNYKQEISKMKIWWNNRISYLDNEINKQ